MVAGHWLVHMHIPFSASTAARRAPPRPAPFGFANILPSSSPPGALPQGALTT